MCKINAQELRAGSIMASKDEKRPILNTVNVQFNDDQYCVAATNSYELFVAGEKSNVGDNPTTYNIRLSFIKGLKATDQWVELAPYLDGTSDEVELLATITNKKLERRLEVWKAIPEKWGKYPNWRSLIPDHEEPCTNWGINSDYVADAMKALKMATKNCVISAHTTSPLKPIVFRAEKAEGNDVLALIMPIRLS